MLSLILVVFALVFAAIASYWEPSPPARWRLGWLGFACYMGSILASHFAR
jgi:hypothetical protein